MTTRVGRPHITILLAVFCAAPVAAQEAGTCGWHFLVPVETPPILVSIIERDLPTDERVRDAIVGMRAWYTDCDHTAARKAAQTLRTLRQRTNSSNPALKALLGIVLLHGPEVQVEHGEGLVVRAVLQGSNSELEGLRLLADVVDQTGWGFIAHDLAEVAVATRRAETLAAAARALHHVLETDNDPRWWIALSEVELMQGDFDAAIATARRADAQSGRTRRALGIAMMLNGAVRDGGDAYLAGLADMSNDAIHRYYDDLRVLLGADEVSQWQDLPAGERGAWIRRKWAWRAQLAGVNVAERLAEHHRRLRHALNTYARISYHGATPTTAVWKDGSLPQLPLDDRGVIYIRHGAPATEMRMRSGISTSMPLRVAWGFTGVGGQPRVFEFDKVKGRGDFFLAEPNPICSGHDVRLGTPLREILGQHRPGDYPATGDLMDWSAQLRTFDPELAGYYIGCTTQDPEDLAIRYFPARAAAQQGADEAFHTETAQPAIQRPLAVATNLYAFRGASGPELIAYLGVPGSQLRPAQMSGESNYSLDVLFTVGDPVTEGIQSVDTTIMFAVREPLAETSVVGIAIPLTVRSTDNARVSITLFDRHEPGTGQVMSAFRVLPSFDDDSISMSDAVIAEARPGTFRRGNARLAPIVGHVVQREGTFRLYVELYGFRQNESFDVSLVIVPTDDGSLRSTLSSLISRRMAMSLEFTESADPDADGIARWDREIAAGDLVSGLYTLEMSVRSLESGRAAVSRTVLVIN